MKSLIIIKSAVTVPTAFAFGVILLLANTQATRAQSSHSVSVTNGASNQVYEIMRISRDSANWSQSGYEITVRNTYYNGGGIVRAFVGYGYQDSGTVTILEAAGQNQPKIFLGSEVVVSGTIKYVPVNIQLPAYQYFSIEIKFGTTETTSISGASQVQFTGTTTTTGATGANHDGSVNFTGNVGIGTTNPAQKLHVAGNVLLNQTNALIFDQNYTVHGNISVTSDGGDSMPRPRYEGYYGHRFITWAGEVMRIQQNGNVGIGTANPYTKLQVAGGDISLDAGQGIRKAGDNWIIGYSTALPGIAIGSGSPSDQVTITSGGYERVRVQSNGFVGIGKTNPSAALDVQGDIKASGVIAARYQDVAEWVRASEQLSAGTVVVLESTKSNQVTSSSVSYDTRVAGVVSEQPGIALGESGEGKVLVATTGRVRVKVDATKGPIHIGDLLVTSDIPGVAMKSEPMEINGRKFHQPGTLIGKALEPLEKGKGEILVLLSLQ